MRIIARVERNVCERAHTPGFGQLGGFHRFIGSSEFLALLMALEGGSHRPFTDPVSAACCGVWVTHAAGPGNEAQIGAQHPTTEQSPLRKVLKRSRSGIQYVEHTDGDRRKCFKRFISLALSESFQKRKSPAATRPVDGTF